ncbi:hypothetical protein D9758_009575 [Tetrapyrgos nigripes]|uniref:DUF7137 domain-containing protein n=1 Tax=Tetrapyrgos nigripes TaxID=182062 RepID=A0A8H5GD12_9AGAR|nr:hypothetical protein D9758_009575 [Tetrapyrgos nigripes]
MSSASQSNSQSQSQSQSGSQSGSQSSSSSAIPQTAPAGIISLTQPPQQSTSFFKLAPSETINFQWSFSGVLHTPTSLTIQAIGANGFTYPIGNAPGTATTINWVPYDYQQSNVATPLAQTTYTLAVFDERGISATMKPGWLSPNTQLKFALYTPQPYTALSSGWSCPECNSATSITRENPALVASFATLLVVFLSGFGLLRNFYAYQHQRQ